MRDFVDKIGYFNLARSTSKLSNHQIKVGAVLVKKKPISAASNMRKTHPICKTDFDRSIHAEVRVVLLCGKDDIKGSTIYVYREHSDGRPALARPCNICYKFLRGKGVRKVIYTIENPPFYKEEKII